MSLLARQQQQPGRYRLARDPSTSRGNAVDLATIGLAGRDPNLLQPGGSRGAIPALVPIPGAQALNLSGRQTGFVPQLSAAGRPVLQHDVQFRAVSLTPRCLNSGPTPVLAPGTIRRNVAWPLIGGGGRGGFSGTANSRPGGPGHAFEVTPVEEYVASSLHLQLPLPLSWPVAGVKPAIGEGPDSTHRNDARWAAASGWPVVAPQVPSFSARVPLRRPRSLVSSS